MAPSPADADHYEVEEIVDHQIDEATGEYQYLIKWLGWAASANTWEPEEHVADALEALSKYWREVTHTTHTHQHNKLDKRITPAGVRLQASLEATFCTPVNISERRPSDGPDEVRVKVSVAALEQADRLRSEEQLRWWQDFINNKEPEGPWVEVVNEVDSAGPPLNFEYVTKPISRKGVPPVRDAPAGFSAGCECPYDCCGTGKDHKCCPALSESHAMYSAEGLMIGQPGQPVYECNDNCACDRETCRNRVVQHGRKKRLGIFRTKNRGWGLRALEPIRKGEFVEQYVGEVVTSEEAGRRSRLYDSELATFLLDLDFNDAEPPHFAIDTGRFGNLGRFINHSCDPNLTLYAVWINNPDPRLPQIAFFASTDIATHEELTFDYYASAIDDSQAKSGNLRCRCGAAKCRKVSL